MPYIISSRSVTDGISLSVSKSKKSKLVYSSLIFVDNKLALICLLTKQLATVSIRHRQVNLLNWWVLYLWRPKSKENGVYDTINHFACNFAQCLPI